jgi:hypothetical protein
MNYKEGENSRWLVIYPDEYLVVFDCLMSDEELLFSVRNDFREHRMCGKFGTNYHPEFSCS